MYNTKHYFPVLLGIMILLSGCSGSNIETTTQDAQSTTTAGAGVAVADSSATIADESEDLPHMVQINGKHLVDAGRSAMVTSEVMDGTISSVVSDKETPTADGQANFPCEGAEYTVLSDGAAGVQVGDGYRLFLSDDIVEYHGIYKKKSDLSDDTLKWLNFYYSLNESERNAISMIPSEFADSMIPSAAAMETADEDAFSGSYMDALTDEELMATEELAQHYFTDDVPVFEGVDQIYPLDSDASLYNNVGLEGEYTPGNIIIFKVLTVKDRRDGNPFRFISIARKSKSDDWKIINSGY